MRRVHRVLESAPVSFLSAQRRCFPRTRGLRADRWIAKVVRDRDRLHESFAIPLALVCLFGFESLGAFPFDLDHSLYTTSRNRDREPKSCFCYGCCPWWFIGSDQHWSIRMLVAAQCNSKAYPYIPPPRRRRRGRGDPFPGRQGREAG